MMLRRCQKLISGLSRGRLVTACNVGDNDCSRNCSTASADNHYDVVVAGGGMVGFALACAFGQSNRLSDLRVLLLESSPSPQISALSKFTNGAPYSNRVVTLAQHSARLLDRLGAWQDMLAVRAGKVTTMQVWESESEAHIRFGDGVHCIAHVLENDLLLETLRAKLPSGVEVRYGSSAESYSLPRSVNEHAVVRLKDGSVLTTALLVGCDGVSSLVRKTMAGQYVSWEYNQMGVVATVELEQEEGEENCTAWQKFLPTGPIALLPLCRNKSSLVWSTSLHHAKELLSLDPDAFTDALNTALWSDEHRALPPWLLGLQENCTDLVRQAGRVLSAVVDGKTPSASVSYKQLPPSVVGLATDSRAAFPLGLGHAVHYTAPRVVLVGDAAHRIHPLAGQGVNLGFGDVAALIRLLEEAVQTGEDIGSSRWMLEYETERQRASVVMMATTDGLMRLYGTTFPPAVFLRTVGLSAVDALQPLKERIESYAKN